MQSFNSEDAAAAVVVACSFTLSDRGVITELVNIPPLPTHTYTYMYALQVCLLSNAK